MSRSLTRLSSHLAYCNLVASSDDVAMPTTAAHNRNSCLRNLLQTSQQVGVGMACYISMSVHRRAGPAGFGGEIDHHPGCAPWRVLAIRDVFSSEDLLVDAFRPYAAISQSKVKCVVWLKLVSDSEAGKPAKMLAASCGLLASHWRKQTSSPT